MQKCWYKLRLETEGCFNPKFKFPTPFQNTEGKYGVWELNAGDVFAPWWLRYMSKLDMVVYRVMIFYRDSYQSTKDAHIDVATTDPLTLMPYAINWVYGGKGSNMVWYQRPENYEKHILKTEAGTPYISWTPSELTEMDRVELTEGTITLVSTEMPHSIEMSKEPRWCFSARVGLKTTLDWDATVEKFRSNNLIIER